MEIKETAVETTTTQAQPQAQAEPKQPTIEELQAQIEKLKASISASNADASKRKKEAQDWQEKYKATLDEQKRKEFEAEENQKQIMAQLSEYKTKERVANYKSKFLAIGYDEQTATSMASTLPEGIEDSFFEHQKAFLEATKQSIKTQTLNSQPGLSTGMPPTASDIQAAEDAKLRSLFGLK